GARRAPPENSGFRCRIQLVSLPHALRRHLVAELRVETRLEALHARLVGAGEDADELAAAAVADDVLLPAELRERLVELRVFVVGLDPVDRERLIELRHRVDVAPQALVELGMDRHVRAVGLDHRTLAYGRGVALAHQRRQLLGGDVADVAVAEFESLSAAAGDSADS